MIYLTLLSVCLFVGGGLEFKYKIHLWRSFKERVVFSLILFAILIPMDMYAVAKGIWNFPGDGILGIYLINLPLEEYLFVLIVPYFILTVYKVVDKKVH